MRVLLSLILFSLPAGASSLCPTTLLTTSFGLRGPLIAGLAPTGLLTVLRDGRAAGAERPDHSLQTTSVALPFQRSLRALASLPDTRRNGGFLGAVSGDGNLAVVLPDGRTLESLLPGKAKAQAVALYREPVRRKEQALGGLRGLREVVPQGMHADRARRGWEEKVNQLEQMSPADLFIASGSDIFHATLRYVDLTGEQEDLRRTLVRGPTYADRPSFSNHFVDWEQGRDAFINFDRVRHFQEFLVPSADPMMAISISGFDRVFTLPEDSIMAETNFMQALSDTRLVVASESGQVMEVDLERGRVVQKIGFPSVVYLSSLTAHLSQGHAEIWAVGNNSTGSHLYRWRSNQLAPLFEKISDFPEGVRPLQVASFGSPVPLAFSPRNAGFLSNMRVGPEGGETEEILVLGNDGALYALRDRLGCFETDCPQDWMRFPFLGN